MPGKGRVVVPGGWCHGVIRGNTWEATFRTDTDRRRFLGRRAELPERFGTEVHALGARRRSAGPRMEGTGVSGVGARRREGRAGRDQGMADPDLEAGVDVHRGDRRRAGRASLVGGDRNPRALGPGRPGGIRRCLD
jgi:hypothetical protein